MEKVKVELEKNEHVNNVRTGSKNRKSIQPPIQSVNLSVLVDEVVTEFIRQRHALKATFEVENNIFVNGNYALLKTLTEKLIQNSINFNHSSLHHSIIFGRAKDDLNTYFIMNSELGVSSSKVLFGAFRYLNNKDLGEELVEIQNIIGDHNGKFWAIGQKGVGSILYFQLIN